MAFFAQRARRTAEEFGKVAGELPVLEWGANPEYRALTADGMPRIFVAREGADWWRIRYQIAHEVFHWLCTPPRTFHWTHEMLAVEIALRAMRGIGEHDYAQRAMNGLVEESGQSSLATILTTPVTPGEPPGLYGRAWVTGRSLIEAVGWERVKLLAQSFDAEGRPDVARWVRSLTEVEQRWAEAVLGAPSPAWV
jgi:hypothetical protein